MAIMRRAVQPDRASARSVPISIEEGYGLRVPCPRTFMGACRLLGVLALLLGLAIWASTSPGTWQNLAGAISVNLGGTLCLLGLAARGGQQDIPFSALNGLLVVYAFRRLLGLTLVLSEREYLLSPFPLIPTVGFIDGSAKAEWLTLLGSVCFFVGWHFRWRGNVVPTKPVQMGMQQVRELWWIYWIALTVFLIGRLAPELLRPGGALLGTTEELAGGAIFVLLYSNDRYGGSIRRRWLAVAAAIPLLAPALTWGMKAGFVTPLMPLGAAMVIKKPSRAIALAVAALGILLFVAFPYVAEYRRTNWGIAPAGATAREVAGDVGSDLKQQGAFDAGTESIRKLQERFGSVSEGGAVVFFADEGGYVGSFFLQSLKYSFIPRLLWPDKPTWDPAAWFSAYLSNFEKSEENPGTATALKLATELYWMNGWPATLVGMLLVGLYCRRVSDFLLFRGSRAPTFFAAWFGFVLMVAFIEETRLMSVIVRPVIIVANAYAVQQIVTTLAAMVRPRGTPARLPSESPVRKTTLSVPRAARW